MCMRDTMVTDRKVDSKMFSVYKFEIVLTGKLEAVFT